MNSYNVGAAAAVARALAAKSITIIGGGQSNTASAYANLYYTPSAFAINGADKVITIPAGYSLKLGDTVYAKQAGATPSSYNDAAYQPYVVGGTMPSGLTLTGPANGASGALSVAGTVQIDMARSYPQAFASLTKKGVTAPLPPARGMNAFTFGGRPNGSPLFALRDRLAELSGADVHVANCGIGSTSLIGDWVGQIQGWVATSRYRVRRTAVPGDPFDRGSLGAIISAHTGAPNNKWILMECTAGGDAEYMLNAGTPLPGITPINYGGTRLTVQGGQTGASVDWSTITAVGQTKVDGGLTWSCVAYDYVNAAADPAIKWAADSRYALFATLKYGFDPFGAIDRLLGVATEAKLHNSVPVVVWIGHENDINSASGAGQWYRKALQSLSDVLTSNGIYFAPSMTYFNTKSGTAQQFADLNTRVSEFIGDNVSNPLVIAGQSLYSFFGQVNGAAGLYPQRDNFHVNEDIHIGAPTVIPAGVAMAETIWPVLRGRI